MNEDNSQTYFYTAASVYQSVPKAKSPHARHVGSPCHVEEMIVTILTWENLNLTYADPPRKTCFEASTIGTEAVMQRHEVHTCSNVRA